MIILGIILILIGLSIWLEKIGFPKFALARNWPILLVLFGLWLLIKGLKKKGKKIKIE
jgi:thiol:disulfide interchange protein